MALTTRFPLTTRILLATVALSIVSLASAQLRSKTLFVTNNTSGSVASMMVLEDGRLILTQTMGSGPNPYDLVPSPGGDRLAVVQASAMVAEPLYTFAIQPTGFLLPAAPPLTIGDGNLSVAMGGSGFALVTQATQDNLISVNINAPQPVVVGSAPAGIFPVEVAVSRTGDIAFVSGTQGDGYLYSYRLNNDGSITSLGAPASTTGIGTGQGLATHPKLDVVYQSTGLGNAILAYTYDAAGMLTHLGTSSGGGNSCVEMAVHPSGKWLYVCNVVSDSLAVVPLAPDGKPGMAIDSEAIGNDIRDVVCDDRFVYVTDESTLGGGTAGIVVFQINNDGTLNRVHTTFSTSGTRPSHMAVVAPISVFNPSSFIITQGTPFGGSVSSLAASDEDKVYILHDESTPNGVIEVTGLSNVVSPWKTELEMEVSATRDDLSLFVDFYDFNANQWDLAGTAMSSLTDINLNFSAQYSTGRYIDGFSTNTARVRVRMVPTQDVEAFDGWLTAIDQVTWTART